LELVNIPVLIPSEFLLSDIIGLVEVLQQTPHIVIVAPTSEVILPPELTDIAEIFDNGDVLTLDRDVMIVY